MLVRDPFCIYMHDMFLVCTNMMLYCGVQCIILYTLFSCLIVSRLSGHSLIIGIYVCYNYAVAVTSPNGGDKAYHM